MSRPYPRMRINQIRQPSQKIAIGDFRDSTSAGNPPPHRFRDRAEAMDTLSVFTDRRLLPWASSCSGQDGRKRSPIPTRRAPTNPTGGSADPQKIGKKRESESDDSALGIISAVKEYGLRVPDDISIIGESGIPGSAFFDPPLATISHDIPRRRCSWQTGVSGNRRSSRTPRSAVASSNCRQRIFSLSTGMAQRGSSVNKFRIEIKLFPLQNGESGSW